MDIHTYFKKISQLGSNVTCVNFEQLSVVYIAVNEKTNKLSYSTSRAKMFLYKSWRTKSFFQFEIIIN